MAGLCCDISSEVYEAANRLKIHFVSILRANGVEDPHVDITQIEDILRSALPLKDLFALQEAVRAVVGIRGLSDKVCQLSDRIDESGHSGQ